METWLSLQLLVKKLNSSPENHNLDSLHQGLLEWIMLRTQENTPLYIQEIVLRSEIASPATIHKIMSNLEAHGLILLTVDVQDARRRRVTTSTKASRRLISLSKSVDQWIASRSKT
jgi:DNA-binding MarR family transcriptional regulator